MLNFLLFSDFQLQGSFLTIEVFPYFSHFRNFSLTFPYYLRVLDSGQYQSVVSHHTKYLLKMILFKFGDYRLNSLIVKRYMCDF